MNDVSNRARLDFELKIISFDEDTGIAEITMTPNPKRYEWRQRNNEKYLFDKLDNVYISETALKDLSKQMINLPVYYEPPKISNAADYIEIRKPLIEKILNGGAYETTFKDKSEDFLRSLEVDKLAFVIMVIDIVNSTALSTQLDSDKYKRVIDIMLYEISNIIAGFNAHVLKYTGDGLIAYFPTPSFNCKNDLAIDCALTINSLVHNAINAIFEKAGFPIINIRIAIDAGEAAILTIGSPETKQHKDIIGSVINITSKIQSLGSIGDILLGEITERNLHTMWREICVEIKTGEKWQYKNSNGRSYKVFKVKTGTLPRSTSDHVIYESTL